MKHTILLFLMLTSGCKGAAEVIGAFPPGTQLQSSTTGLRIAPTAADGAPVTFGSHTSIVTTPNPQDVGANLNRFEATAPWIELKSTVATGPVGDELNKAGGPAALRYLIGNDHDTKPPAELATTPQEFQKSRQR